jgi:hypothetical protein
VRRYDVGDTLALHVDKIDLYEDTILTLVLECGAGDGVTLAPYNPGWQENVSSTDEFAVKESPGLAVCLQGAARYEYGHAVPPVCHPRVSLTWRWFRPGVLALLTSGQQVT